MKIHPIIVSPFLTNCYVLGCEDTQEAIIIDAGFNAEKILHIIEKEGYTLKYLINTHAHLDHISAVAEIKEKYNVPLFMHKGDQPVLDSLVPMQMQFGFGNHKIPTVDIYLEEKKYSFGNIEFQVIHTPGHSPGGCCFLFNDVLFSGDTLFGGSIGRTDLPGGSMEEIINSIKTKLLKLDDGVAVYPGHGPSTTIEKEKQFNSFLAG